MDHRSGAEEEAGLEERVGENVEEARGERPDADAEKHEAELADGRVSQTFLMFVLHQPDRRREERGGDADQATVAIRERREKEHAGKAQTR